MKEKISISIIFANRNRDIRRIRLAMESLKNQECKSFEVIFIDYGSDLDLSLELQSVLKSYDFIQYYYLEVSHQLWNKSRALNYGIKRANKEFIFIADVDLIFHPSTVQELSVNSSRENYQLFRLGYLSEKESLKLDSNFIFEDLLPTHYGDVNGMILTSKESLERIHGFDEFFHFYGSEDVDLYSRLDNLGYQCNSNSKTYFLHNWHPTFSGSEKNLFTDHPRVKNIMRINQRHFLRNKNNNIVKPNNQEKWGEIIGVSEMKTLEFPTKKFIVSNIASHVEHFLNEELSNYTNEIIQVEFIEDPYFNSLKYKLKKLYKKQTQPYSSMKDVNDMVLKKIVFEYRNSNYSIKINKDKKTIIFKIQL